MAYVMLFVLFVLFALLCLLRFIVSVLFSKNMCFMGANDS